jgi:hypothetical protein
MCFRHRRSYDDRRETKGLSSSHAPPRRRQTRLTEPRRAAGWHAAQRGGAAESKRARASQSQLRRSSTSAQLTVLKKTRGTGVRCQTDTPQPARRTRAQQQRVSGEQREKQRADDVAESACAGSAARNEASRYGHVRPGVRNCRSTRWWGHECPRRGSAASGGRFVFAFPRPPRRTAACTNSCVSSSADARAHTPGGSQTGGARVHARACVVLCSVEEEVVCVALIRSGPT